MNVCRPLHLSGALLMLLALGCSGRKQVPFGLGDAGVDAAQKGQAVEGSDTLPVGEVFEPGQVEVPIEETTLVLQSGYALTALRLDLDGSEPVDALVVSADPQEVRLQAGYPRGMTVASRTIDSFLVPSHCTDPVAEIRQLSATLVGVRVEHTCETGKRQNFWILTIEAQPRARERITVLPPTDRSPSPITLALRAEDRDSDGYDDVVADVRIGTTQVPLAWLNRPGGFARDVSQPEAALRELADRASQTLSSDVPGAEKLAREVLDAFAALCRESDAARLGLSGTHGLQCQQSAAAARASTVAIAAAIRRGSFVRALELQRWWENPATQPTPEDRALVQAAWRRAKANTTASWRVVDVETSSAPIHFIDGDTLVIGGRGARKIHLSTGEKTRLSEVEITPPIHDPDGRFTVTGVRVTCGGFEAEVGPIRSKQTHRVPIGRSTSGAPCRVPIDRHASPFEWAVLGWAPQGLLVGFGDRLKIVPLNAFAKPAGRPIDLRPGSPLPAPIRGARITPDGARYVIPHAEGIVVRDWQGGGAGRWIRPSDWDAVPGGIRSIAISPDGRRIAIQKGSEIRVLTW